MTEISETPRRPALRAPIVLAASGGGHLDLLVRIRAVAADRDRVWLTSPGSRARQLEAEGERVVTVDPTDDEKAPVKELSEHEKKKQTFITRAIWTLVMIAFFFGSMFAGHIYMLIIVTAVQIISYKEVIAIANVPSRARSLRFTKTLNWYFLGSTMYFLYGESVIYYFKHIVLVDKVLLPFATHHRFISFMLYVMGKFSAAQSTNLMIQNGG